MPAGNLRKRNSPVFVPSKPWASGERSRKMPGAVAVPGRFFEQVYVEKGRISKLGKKGIISVSENTLNRLISNPRLSRNLKAFLADVSKEKKIELTEISTLAKINSITKILSRKNFSPEEFSFLEDLRLSLIQYLRSVFGK